MEKLFKFLFVGGSIFMHFKATLWLAATLFLVSIIENGASDGELHEASKYILVFGFILTALSLALTLHYEREREAAKPVRNFPGHTNPPPVPVQTPGFQLPPMGPPVNFPTDPRDSFPHFPIENPYSDKA